MVWQKDVITMEKDGSEVATIEPFQERSEMEVMQESVPTDTAPIAVSMKRSIGIRKRLAFSCNDLAEIAKIVDEEEAEEKADKQKANLAPSDGIPSNSPNTGAPSNAKSTHSGLNSELISLSNVTPTNSRKRSIGMKKIASTGVNLSLSSETATTSSGNPTVMGGSENSLTGNLRNLSNYVLKPQVQCIGSGIIVPKAGETFEAAASRNIKNGQPIPSIENKGAAIGTYISKGLPKGVTDLLVNSFEDKDYDDEFFDGFKCPVENLTIPEDIQLPKSHSQFQNATFVRASSSNKFHEFFARRAPELGPGKDGERHSAPVKLLVRSRREAETAMINDRAKAGGVPRRASGRLTEAIYTDSDTDSLTKDSQTVSKNATECALSTALTSGAKIMAHDGQNNNRISDGVMSSSSGPHASGQHASGQNPEDKKTMNSHMNSQDLVSKQSGVEGEKFPENVLRKDASAKKDKAFLRREREDKRVRKARMVGRVGPASVPWDLSGKNTRRNKRRKGKSQDNRSGDEPSSVPMVVNGKVVSEPSNSKSQSEACYSQKAETLTDAGSKTDYYSDIGESGSEDSDLEEQIIHLEGDEEVSSCTSETDNGSDKKISSYYSSTGHTSMYNVDSTGAPLKYGEDQLRREAPLEYGEDRGHLLRSFSVSDSARERLANYSTPEGSPPRSSSNPVPSRTGSLVLSSSDKGSDIKCGSSLVKLSLDKASVVTPLETAFHAAFGDQKVKMFGDQRQDSVLDTLDSTPLVKTTSNPPFGKTNAAFAKITSSRPILESRKQVRDDTSRTYATRYSRSASLPVARRLIDIKESSNTTIENNKLHGTKDDTVIDIGVKSDRVGNRSIDNGNASMNNRNAMIDSGNANVNNVYTSSVYTYSEGKMHSSATSSLDSYCLYETPIGRGPINVQNIIQKENMSTPNLGYDIFDLQNVKSPPNVNERNKLSHDSSGENAVIEPSRTQVVRENSSSARSSATSSGSTGKKDSFRIKKVYDKISQQLSSGSRKNSRVNSISEMQDIFCVEGGNSAGKSRNGNNSRSGGNFSSLGSALSKMPAFPILGKSSPMNSGINPTFSLTSAVQSISNSFEKTFQKRCENKSENSGESNMGIVPTVGSSSTSTGAKQYSSSVAAQGQAGTSHQIFSKTSNISVGMFSQYHPSQAHTISTMTSALSPLGGDRQDVLSVSNSSAVSVGSKKGEGSRSAATSKNVSKISVTTPPFHPDLAMDRMVEQSDDLHLEDVETGSIVSRENPVIPEETEYNDSSNERKSGLLSKVHKVVDYRSLTLDTLPSTTAGSVSALSSKVIALQHSKESVSYPQLKQLQQGNDVFGFPREDYLQYGLFRAWKR